jgi:hypothetical protein
LPPVEMGSVVGEDKLEVPHSDSVIA